MYAYYPCWMIMEGLRLIFPAVGSYNSLPIQSLSSRVFCWLDKQTSQYLTRQEEHFRISKIHRPDGWVDSVQLYALDYRMNNATIKMAKLLVYHKEFQSFILLLKCKQQCCEHLKILSIWLCFVSSIQESLLADITDLIVSLFVFQNCTNTTLAQ